MQVRAQIGDMLNRVALRHDTFIIERKGRALAALVPVEQLEQLRAFARRHALGFLERQKTGPGRRLSDDQAMAVALDAQREARKSSTKRKSRRSKK